MQSKKSKVGLVSSYKLQNYGAVLQSLATLIYLQQAGFEVECVDYSKDKSFSQLLKSLHLFFITDVRQMKLQSVKRKLEIALFHSSEKKIFAQRGRLFRSFVEKYFPSSSPICGFNNLKKQGDSYRAVLIGSDQVWHPINLGTHLNDLSWVSDVVPKISYASSFGVSEIPCIQKKATKQYLSRLDAISVREAAGAKIVKELTGLEVPVVCDPTLLLTSSDWDGYTDNSPKYDEPYILCYFLGDNQEHRMFAEKLGKEKGIKIISLPHISAYNRCDSNFGNIQDFAVGPAEFLNLVKNASYICTDSFHASVFSIIFHKKFVVFNRYKAGHGSKNSRIDTLLGVTHLEERRGAADALDLSLIDQFIDYDKVDELLREYRVFSKEIFNKMLSGI